MGKAIDKDNLIIPGTNAHHYSDLLFLQVYGSPFTPGVTPTLILVIGHFQKVNILSIGTSRFEGREKKNSS